MAEKIASAYWTEKSFWRRLDACCTRMPSIFTGQKTENLREFTRY
jgi:hypothetical protein